MSVGRYARHTLPGHRIATRQEEIYAEDMYGQSPWAGADPTKGLTGQSPRWQYSASVNQGVCADYKVPEDRVPGTPIRVYLVYSVPGNGLLYIVWVLTYVVVPLGAVVTGVATVRSVTDVTEGLDILAMTDPILLPASLFDNEQKPTQLQLTFNRFASALEDDDPNVADLFKAIVEYQAYV